jgi:hypothetical protein
LGRCVGYLECHADYLWGGADYLSGLIDRCVDSLNCCVDLFPRDLADYCRIVGHYSVDSYFLFRYSREVEEDL